MAYEELPFNIVHQTEVYEIRHYVDRLAVQATYTNQDSNFRALFNYIEQLARNRTDVKALRLYVIQDNESGKNTYEALGMRDSQYIVYEKKDLD